MSILGLHVGVSFAEFSLLADGSRTPLAFQRVYLPRMPLKTALQKFLQKYSDTKVDNVFFVSHHLEKLAPFRLGGSTAHLMTEGFENLNWLSQINSTPMSPQRLPAVQSQELIFPVKERMAADGKVIDPLDINFISSIAAKLKLMDIKKVCIHFLHSQKNPAHLNQTRDLLKEQGFEIFHADYDTDSDIEKSRRLALSVALTSTWDEMKADLVAVLRESGDCKINIFTDKGFKDIDSSIDPLEALAGLDHLWEHLPFKNVVYLGFENFFQLFPKERKKIWSSPWGQIYREHAKKTIFKIQPTSGLSTNFWNELELNETADGFEPGPMALGRGQRPMAFDLFFDELIEKDDIKDWLSPAAQNKINSSLTALAKNSKTHTLTTVQKKLREQFLNRIRLNIENTNDKPEYFGFWSDLFRKELKIEKTFQPVSELVAKLDSKLEKGK